MLRKIKRAGIITLVSVLFGVSSIIGCGRATSSFKELVGEERKADKKLIQVIDNFEKDESVKSWVSKFQDFYSLGPSKKEIEEHFSKHPGEKKGLIDFVEKNEGLTKEIEKIYAPIIERYKKIVETKGDEYADDALYHLGGIYYRTKIYNSYFLWPESDELLRILGKKDRLPKDVELVVKTHSDLIKNFPNGRDDDCIEPNLGLLADDAYLAIANVLSAIGDYDTALKICLKVRHEYKFEVNDKELNNFMERILLQEEVHKIRRLKIMD